MVILARRSFFQLTNTKKLQGSMDTDSLPRYVCLPGPKYRNIRAWSADTCFLALCFNLRKPLLSWYMQISCRTDKEHTGEGTVVGSH